MAELSFEVETVPALDRGALVRVTGAIDAKTVVVFQDRLDNLQEEGFVNYILDMEGIKYVNSTGLGTLVNVADSLENAGGGIALVKIHPKVKVVFDMLGLNAFFKIFKNENEARLFLNAGGNGSASTDESETTPSKEPSTPKSDARKSAPETKTERTVEVIQAQGELGNYSVPCKSCHVRLTLKKPGSYKCPRCGNFFKLAKDATVQFFHRSKSAPLQMRLACTDECLEGLGEFVAVLARRIGFDPSEVSSMKETLASIGREIIEKAYGNEPNQSYQVVISPSSTEIRIQFADHGQFLEGNQVFSSVGQAMDTFDHKRHPKGGNVVTLTKRI
ncbi:MAG: STAS domain-containing protein [Planctomycetota bacterium]|nr:STAS domain-containing protein [Planctomycetota bacterium]